MGGVACPACFATATKKRMEEVGSTKRKPTQVLSRSKEIRSREMVDIPRFQADARIGGAEQSCVERLESTEGSWRHGERFI